MRHAQSSAVRTTPATALQHCCVGDPPPLVLPVTKLRHGVKVLISDAVHDVATACPDTDAAADSTITATATTAPIAPSRLMPPDCAFSPLFRACIYVQMRDGVRSVVKNVPGGR
jgi:hypothetical protein